MVITQEHFELLQRIYNTMLEINTKGQDTLIMSDCLRALDSLINAIEEESSAIETQREKGE